MTIIVMDDNDEVRNVVVRCLKKEGYAVLDFPDARPALDTVNFADVDLLITDLVMPTPGEEAVKILREQGVQIPVIAMSATITEEKEQYLKSIGVQQILQKPFDFVEFRRLVNTFQPS